MLKALKKALISFPHLYSSDWVTAFEKDWAKVLQEFKGKPDLHFLEVGVFQGRASIWMLQNILTHPSSRMTGIDLFQNVSIHVPRWNYLVAGVFHKVTLHKGDSLAIIPQLSASFDFIYVDGSHETGHVLQDAMLCWGKLKPQGVIIFDDYQLENSQTERPGEAIDQFMQEKRGEWKLIHQGWQIVLQKVSST